MNDDKIFRFLNTSRDGIKILGAGICPNNKIKEAKEIFSKLNNINLGLSKNDSPYEIDSKLNIEISKLAPKYIRVLAISIKVEGVNDNCGGIIGKPSTNYEESINDSTDIDGDYKYLALNGGPGVAIKGNNFKLKNFFNRVVKGKNMLIADNFILDAIIDLNIEMAIIVTDGSGNCGRGMLITYFDNEMEKVIL